MLTVFSFVISRFVWNSMKHTLCQPNCSLLLPPPLQILCHSHYIDLIWYDFPWVRDLTAPIHLGLCQLALCAPCQLMGALSLYWSCRWPLCLYSCYPMAPRRSPGMHVWVRPKPHIHKECGLKFPLSLHTSCTLDCLAALAGEGASSWCCDQ